jgi:WKF domain
LIGRRNLAEPATLDFPAGDEREVWNVGLFCEADSITATQSLPISAEVMMATVAASNDYAASTAIPIRRVPAWKKLGLKLKFADEHTDLPTQLDSSTSTNKKRRRDDDSRSLPAETETEHALKKRPPLGLPKAPSKISNGTEVETGSPALKKDSNGVRKSVSFTSDTKLEDGDSSKSLIADWEAQYDQPSFPASSPTHSEPLERRSSRLQKSKSPLNTKKPHTALEYLTRFRQARETWKFSKNKEIWILNHLFSPDDIPFDYDISLGQYLAGLKSSAARLRIRQEAREIVQRDQEQKIEEPVLSSSGRGAARANAVPANMEDPERRRYKRKLERHLDDVAGEELNWVSPERLAKRRRAEIILWATGVTPPSVEATQSSDSITSRQSASRSASYAPENGIETNHPLKKRKNRTSVIELSSSSSEDETSSGSDSEDEGGEEESDESSSISSSSKATATHTQRSASTQFGQEAGSDDDTESSSGLSERPDDYDANPDKTAISRGRPKSIISISS